MSAKFRGYDVVAINDEADTMFRAAIKGLYDSQDIEPGTPMVIGDDNQTRIYASPGCNQKWTAATDIECFRMPTRPKAKTIDSVDVKYKKQAETKLDTAALDEFLGSFKVLGSAT